MGLSSEGDSRFSFRAAFENDTELKQYGSNSLAVFALALYLRLEDPHEFAADAITGRSDDKKVDICYINETEGRAIIAQAYIFAKLGQTNCTSEQGQRLETQQQLGSCQQTTVTFRHIWARKLENFGARCGTAPLPV